MCCPLPHSIHVHNGIDTGYKYPISDSLEKALDKLFTFDRNDFGVPSCVLHCVTTILHVCMRTDWSFTTYTLVSLFCWPMITIQIKNGLFFGIDNNEMHGIRRSSCHGQREERQPISFFCSSLYFALLIESIRENFFFVWCRRVVVISSFFLFAQSECKIMDVYVKLCNNPGRGSLETLNLDLLCMR